jgi:hypothetical protein
MAKGQLSLVTMLLVAAFLCCLTTTLVRAQIVEPNVERFTAKECKWLHSGFLDACKSSEICGPYPDEFAYPMVLQRGMSSLETVLTATARSRLEAACEGSCRSKSVVPYAHFRRAVCAPLLRH